MVISFQPHHHHYQQIWTFSCRQQFIYCRLGEWSSLQTVVPFSRFLVVTLFPTLSIWSNMILPPRHSPESPCRYNTMSPTPREKPHGTSIFDSTVTSMSNRFHGFTPASSKEFIKTSLEQTTEQTTIPPHEAVQSTFSVENHNSLIVNLPIVVGYIVPSAKFLKRNKGSVHLAMRWRQCRCLRNEPIESTG